jgi:hypothetical protein
VSRSAEPAVRRVPSVVICVIARISFMAVATRVAEAACSCVALAIEPISSASWFDTCSISRSALSASSAVLVPSTTPRVLRSMASIASCVSP